MKDDETKLLAANKEPNTLYNNTVKVMFSCGTVSSPWDRDIALSFIPWQNGSIEPHLTFPGKYITPKPDLGCKRAHREETQLTPPASLRGAGVVNTPSVGRWLRYDTTHASRCPSNPACVPPTSSSKPHLQPTSRAWLGI